MQILLAILGISILVTLHEWGHYFVARRCGMRVHRFSIGMGPVIAKWQPKGSETTFQICLIPFLAYVAIHGLGTQDASKTDGNEVPTDDPGSYQSKSWWARALTVVAGPLANYLTASVLVFAIALTGWPEERPLVPMAVGELSPGAPAARAGLKTGDKIVRADGKSVRTIDDLIQATAPRAGLPTEYVVERIENGQTARKTFVITPNNAPNPGKIAGPDGSPLAHRGVIGVAPMGRRYYDKKSLGESLKASVVLPWVITKSQLVELTARFRQGSMEGISGPIGMGKIVAKQAGQGWREYATILMVLSVALGMFNLLPLPALDGGRLLFLGIEAVTRRKANMKVEALVHAVGLVMLLSLLVWVTFRDIQGPS